MKKPRQRYTIEDLIRKQGRWIGGIDPGAIKDADGFVYGILTASDAAAQPVVKIYPAECIIDGNKYPATLTVSLIPTTGDCEDDSEYFSDEP